MIASFAMRKSTFPLYVEKEFAKPAIRICGIDRAARCEGEIAESLSGFPSGADRQAKKSKTYTVSYTYTPVAMIYLQ